MTADPAIVLSEVFVQLRALYRPHEPACVLLRDTAENYSLGTHEVRAKDGYRTAFGSVVIGKRYVSAHLMPVYMHPALLDDITPALRKRMQGKSCFNFAAVDTGLFAELGGLVQRGADQFAADGRLTPPA